LGQFSGPPPRASIDWGIAIVATILAFVGVGVAWWAYRDGRESVPDFLDGIYRLARDKLFVDEIYEWVLVKPAEMVATAGRQLDAFLEALTRLLAHVPRLLGAALRPLQNGLIQFYALGMVLGLTVFLIVIVFRSTR
jgi:NADH-quinone oxidoreductase subunit L